MCVTRHRAQETCLHHRWLVSVGPFLPFWQRDNSGWCSALDSWKYRISCQISPFFGPSLTHTMVNGFSEQSWAIQPIHCYLPAPCCLPTRTSAPAMQPMPRMQTTIPMKCTALYRTSKKNQERSITTGMTKQSRSCQKTEQKSGTHQPANTLS